MSGKHNPLATNKLEAFKLWLDAQGIDHRPGRGTYQVLQVKSNEGWQVVYRRDNSKEYYSIPHPLVPLVQQFLTETKEPTASKGCKHYLIVVEGDLEPYIDGEPEDEYRAVVWRAKAYRKVFGDNDGLYCLVIDEHGNPKITGFTGGEVNG